MDDDIKSLINEAICKIKHGRVEDALLVLERTVLPKFSSAEHAQGALLMHNPNAAQSEFSNFLGKALGHQVGA